MGIGHATWTAFLRRRTGTLSRRIPSPQRNPSHGSNIVPLQPDRDLSAKSRSALAGPLPGENKLVWTVWLTYGAFYFCRQNLSAAVPGMGASQSEGGLGLSNEEIGYILASLKLTYGFGQLLNGQLSEWISPRKLLALGMLGSAAVNCVFGLAAGFWFLLFVWATNGYLQSFGWTPCVRVLSDWIPVLRRGRAIGLVGTGYQVTLGVTYLVATQAAEHLGWRGALFVPAGMLVASAVVMLLFLEEKPPSEESAPEESGEQPDELPDDRASNRTDLIDNFVLTFTNPYLWLLGLSLGLLNACRYGFLDWGLLHLMTVQDVRIGKAGLSYVVLPFGAVLGSYLTGWATDRFFGGRRAPVICILLVALGVITLAYESAARASGPVTVGLLVLVGFCIYGPQVLLVGTAPADLARRGTAAAAAGFVNFLGYMGAALGDVVTGYYTRPEHGGWEVAIYIWAGWAFAAAALAGLLWFATAAAASSPADSESSGFEAGES
jgi:MFS transporter, OPA family, glycerol-3-phosphate transporter